MGAAGSILWSSSRPRVATINDRGVATGIDDGVSIITATLGQLSGSTTLTVGTVFTLTVTKQGTGNGTVISFNLPGINCGIDCLEAYGVSTGVTLQANEDNGSLFAGWTGDPDCTDGIVTMNANKTCTATFDLDVHTITITRDGTGTGTVLIGGPGGPVVCGNDCQATYPTGTGIILDVLPGADSEFAGWSGDPDCADAHVLMDADKTCTATFNLQSHRLIIGKPGNGSGTVTSVNVPGINCGNDCSEPYPVGTRATLQAVPDQWNDFAWGGDPDCNDGEVTIGNADVTCFAVFNIQTFTMTVTKAGNGRGVVITNEQGGINCGLDCPSADKTYNGGTEVTLTAATDVPWLFAGWSGDPDCADGLVTMNANKTCTAEFNRQVFRLNIQRDAESVVSSEDGRIDCGIDCDETYDGGTEVRLTVDTTVQSRGQGLVILSGDPGCSNGVMEIGQVIFFNVTVTMDTDKTCIATFHSFEELQFNQMLMLRNESQKTPEFRIENGIPRFISMRVPIPAALPDDPVIQALDFLDRYKYLYRIKEPKGDLYLERIKTNRFNAIGGGPPDPSDRAQHLFFGQLANGILVHGASLAVHMRGNMITSTSGKYLTKIPAVTLPAVQAPAAEAIALGSVQGNDKKVIGVTKLFYYNRGLTAIGGGTPDPSNTPTRLAWRVMVRGLRSSDGAGTSWRLFIDAKDGAVLSKIDEMREGEPDKDFDIQSASNTESNNCWARTDVAGIADWFNENGQTGNYPGPAGDLYSDGQNAYDFAHLTYDFYHTNFGRHSWYDIDDFWGAEEAEVDVWVHVGNNWNNASYRPDCDHLTFGEGYMANDTFVHEYTHAVTRWSSNLEYENQSGALNESYSDVMAALLDGDWLEGEDNPTRGEDGDRGATLGGNLVGDGNREKGDECDNNIDDDGDGFINEGCPETGNQCGNGVDDDGDGFIDEGCPETGNQCGNLVDDDGDGFIDEGCPGSCQDGIDNGLTGEADSADTDCFTRDLANPARKSDPDHRIGSMSGDGIGLRILGLNEAVNCDRNDPNFNDCGYVHTNSGIPNKAAYLLTVGGVHTGSGVEVRGIGPEKVMRLYYDVLTSRLHSNSQFYDARDATIEQAQEYVDNNEYEFVQADVCSVMNAFAAVGYGDSDIDCDGVLDRDTTDNDGDSIIDGDDNCPQAANPGQDDMNGNGIGDRCDPDKDGDGVDDIFDNCPTVANANQADADPNTPEGDACEDHDGDGLFDTADNCPNDFNPDQADRYGTTLGDACETDNDNDGIENESDNCPSTPNPGQADWDGDGVGDACDNCVRAANLNQRDMDRDGEGNACDDDIDGDGIPNADDQCPENALPIIILGGSEVLPCRSNEDLAALLSGNYGDFVNGMMFFPSLSDSMKLPIFPCIDDGCPDWIAENYQTEVYMSLPVNFQARIIDDKGFAVRKGITGMQQTLRFHPAADSFFRFQSVSAGGALSEVSPQGLTQLTAYKGRNYFLEIYPAADVVAGQQYPFTIRVKSYQATSNISVSPTFSDFGNINVGSTTTQTFTVNNTGSADLLISQISILPPGDFSKGLDNCSGRSLLPEEGCTVRVHFSPTLATVRVATLSIPSNAPDTPILNVALNGMGTSASVFNDAPEGSFAENFINTLFYSGITGGCGGGKFCPNDPITRGQMAVFIESSLGNPPNTCTGQFTDVPIGHPFCGFIERLAADGVTGGCGEGKYCPDDPVTRGQMAVFIEAAMGNSASGCGGQFADVPIGHPFCGFIEKLASDGITGGCGDGNFCPDNPVTRAQMAVFLVAAPAPLFP
jgi:Zn-dependent metalloprotease